MSPQCKSFRWADWCQPQDQQSLHAFQEVTILLQALLLLSTADPLQVKVHVPSDPISAAWLGGNMAVLGSNFHSLAFSRDQYEEEGSDYMRTKRHHHYSRV